MVLHAEGDDSKIPVLDHGNDLVGAVDRDGLGHETGAGLGQQLRAVVRDTVARVVGVRALDAAGDGIDAGPAVHGKGIASTLRPGIEDDLAQPPDVIRVEVGQQHAGQAAERQAQERDALPSARPRVDEENAMAREHGDACGASLRIGDRRAGSAKHDVQRTLFHEPYAIGLDAPGDDGADRAVLQGRGAQQCHPAHESQQR